MQNLLILSGLCLAAAAVVCFVMHRAWRARELQSLRELAAGEYLNHAKVARSLSGERAINRRRKLIKQINAEFEKRRLADCKQFFDRLELTGAQRLAVVRDEDANLINAGAGSGKTRTVLGKVAYLLTRGLAAPDEILIVVYNNSMQREIKPRAKEVHREVTVSTFHALGYTIIRETERPPAKISELAGEDGALPKFLAVTMREILEDASLRHILIEFFANYRFERDADSPARNKDEYLRRIRYAELKALDGSELKSHQEVQIANWLTLNGIAWQYEKPYPHHRGARPYRPDFYLPDYDLWLEHFGVDEDGEPPAFFGDPQQYKKGMQWKRKLHARNQTTLVETFSYEASRPGGLVAALEKKLAAHFVETRPMSAETIARLVRGSFQFASNFIKLIVEFLMLCRENKLDAAALQQRAETPRDRAFLTLFDLFRARYEARLVADDAIDFTDMITRGRHYVLRDKYRSPFKYILVDEYQDITRVRLDLLLAMRRQVRDARLFCVGDDWQSIYQFQGADVGLITNFGQHVGAMQRTDLDKTFRFGQKLSDFGMRFITKNPAQLRKKIESVIDSAENAKPVRIYYHDETEQHEKLREIVAQIARQSGGGRADCLVLGRYNDAKPRNWKGLQHHAVQNNVALTYMTIHKAKGIEADWTVVVENKTDAKGLGFPSEVEGDPVLKMVLDYDRGFKHAEERRLFYVAVTRARRGVFLLSPAGETSDFIREIDPREEVDDYRSFVHVESGAAERPLVCAECNGETIRKRIRHDGMAMYVCANEPACKGRLPVCANAACEAAVDVSGAVGDSYRCECGTEAEICPRCRRGILVLRDSQRGKFWGCSRYAVADCRYAR